MNTSTRLGVYGAALVAVFGAALGIGRAAGPVGGGSEDGHGGHSPAAAAEPQEDAAASYGLQRSAGGYALDVLSAPTGADGEAPLTFRITGPDGRPVTSFSRQHDKLMHLIVTRRDLSGYRHLHPVMAPDGTWSVPVAWPHAGTYRVFADFDPAGGAPATLGTDVQVAGAFTPRPLPAPSATDEVDGYEVTLHGGLVPGASAPLALRIIRDGREVRDLQPYLGAYGHLVALRDGDLAYLHVHPRGEPGDGSTEPGPEIAFEAEAPSAGAYRLFLDFRHGGRVHTAEFTVHAGAEAGEPGAPAAGSGGGHSH